ncbi:MAG TPA: UDP-N-acetylmuramoyl-tripeptide--D-alanyl-D-alanine ligase, partial [Phycisphaerales bacterium]|nr:UDP-N-acetylmuramoyl-tripeptide--D-alanyl-D-alanine ligase [Phycisphaerales bacterium]
MSFWAPESLRSAAGGTWLARPGRGPGPAHGLSTDTRTLAPGQAFLALRGEHFDGHAFLRAAVAAGAATLIIDRPALADGVPAPPGGVIAVPDTGRALLRLASAYRDQLERATVIGVAGSNGKTTTARLIQAVLATTFRGTAPAKSFNNAVGVPLTVLSADPDDEYLVCEIGTNHPGEIAELAGVVRPDIAVITSIGREHLEGLGSLAGVAREEADLLTYIRPGGVAVATADAPELAPYLRCLPEVITFGASAGAHLRLAGAAHELAPDGLVRLRLRVSDGRAPGGAEAAYLTPLLGAHNALNVLAALAVARRLGVPEAAIAAALAGARPAPMRLEPQTAGGIALLNDAYNANPESMAAALRTLAELVPPGGRRVAVLGDMLELGPEEERFHREIGAHARARGVDVLV